MDDKDVVTLVLFVFRVFFPPPLTKKQKKFPGLSFWWWLFWLCVIGGYYQWRALQLEKKKQKKNIRPFVELSFFFLFRTGAFLRNREKKKKKVNLSMCRSWIKVYIAFGRLVTHATFCCCQCVVLQVFIIFFLSIRWLDAQNGSLSFLFVDFMTFGPVSDLERIFFFKYHFCVFF